MKKLSLGKQELSNFKEENLIYVDKTRVIYDLIDQGSYYFLSRPRRFGKSLLVNTIKEIFLGNRELFEGCWIHDHWNWEEQNPVIKISFTEVSYRTNGLAKALEIYLSKLAKDHGVHLEASTYPEQFIELIQTLGQKKKVVILIDEYDKPIIDYLEHISIDRAIENREILKSLYAGIKDQDQYIRFLFMTGISKFSRVSIFSVLNHLKDISLNKQFSTIVGYTAEEIQQHYKGHLKALAEELETSEKEIMDLITQWYDGYSWDGKTFLFNPFSVINLLFDKKFNSFWFQTGTPTFLVKLLKESNQTVDTSLQQWIGELSFESYDIENLNITAIMFQTGYLTIKKTKPLENKYLLDFPNQEVKNSFLHFMMNSYSYRSLPDIEKIMGNLFESLKKKQISLFIQGLKSLFSSIPLNEFKHVKHFESYYHTVVYITLKLIGIDINCEVQTNHGMIDALIKTEDTIYVLEFKMGKAEEAMKQIKEKKYYEPYLSDSREVILLGIGFDEKDRNVGDFLDEEAK